MSEFHTDRDAIREHYDRLSVFYRELWGEHIHHGYWEGDESPAAAQVKLIERLAERARIPRGVEVLDVGCGLGGSARWLARNLGCSVLGITISPVQQTMAADQAQAEGWEGRLRFEVMDANRLDLPPEHFDVVWVIECSEHLADKARFIESCARVLRPGGRLALCAWLVAERLTTAEHVQLVADVSRGMLSSLVRRHDYTGWMQASGFDQIEAEDITPRVERTWAHCQALVQRPDIQALVQGSDARTRAFIQAFAALQRAYAEGAMAYGMFTARKARGSSQAGDL